MEKKPLALPLGRGGRGSFSTFWAEAPSCAKTSLYVLLTRRIRSHERAGLVFMRGAGPGRSCSYVVIAYILSPSVPPPPPNPTTAAGAPPAGVSPV